MLSAVLRLVLVAAAFVVFAAPAGSGISASRKGSSPSAGILVVPRLYKNCTNFNKRYRHGVGRVRVHPREGGGRFPCSARSAKSCEPEGPQDLTTRL
jgi:hypothetical protein